MLIQQKFCCKICGIHCTDNLYGKLYVDHNHKTGKTRGLLCMKCNAALGKFGDSIEGLSKALQYLQEYEEL